MNALLFLKACLVEETHSSLTHESDRLINLSPFPPL